MSKVGILKAPKLSGTKLDLFKTAINLFAQNGFANVSVRDIAAAMNLNVASLYNHFPSKDAFLTEAYEYYRYNYYTALPCLEQLLDLVPCTPPQQIWHKMWPVYDPEIIDIMSKIAIIAIDERHRSPEAYDLIYEVYIKTPKKYIRTLLAAMIEQGIIEPVDIDNFSNIHSAFNLYASVRLGGYHSMSAKEWRQGHDYIFRFLRPKNTC